MPSSPPSSSDHTLPALVPMVLPPNMCSFLFKVNIFHSAFRSNFSITEHYLIFLSFTYLVFCFTLLPKCLLCSPGLPGTCYVSKYGFKFMILWRYLLSVGITDMYHHVQQQNSYKMRLCVSIIKWRSTGMKFSWKDKELGMIMILWKCKCLCTCNKSNIDKYLRQ